MPVKRRLPKGKKHRLTPELIPKAERLLKLGEDHLSAIRGEDEAFYTV